MDSNQEKNYPKGYNEKYAILIVGALILLGITYAIQSASSLFRGQTATIEIDEEAYGENDFDSTNLQLIPILDNEVENSGDNVIRIDFRVGGAKNNSDKIDIIYDIALADLEIDCNLVSPYLKWKLIKNDQEISHGSFDYKFDTIKDGRLVLTNTQQDLVKYSDNKDDYDNYIFYIWLSDNCQGELSTCKDLPEQTNLLSKKLKGKIEIELNSGGKVEIQRNPTEELDTSTCITENSQITSEESTTTEDNTTIETTN